MRRSRRYTRPAIKTQEMPEHMSREAVDFAVKAFQEHRSENEIAFAELSFRAF